MYEFAYNDVIEDSRQSMRAREREAMDKVIGLLRDAQTKDAGARARVDALFYLKKLWTIFLDDLTHPNNELSEQLRAGLISIGVWMMKEIERARASAKGDLTPMIEINEIVRDGLK